MGARIARTGTGHDSRLWPVLLLLLLVVLAPTACLLWFMSRAIENERLAIRQKLEEAYRRDLAGVQLRIDQFWRDRAAALERLDRGEPSPQVFARVVGGSLADSVVCYDPQGQVVYPNAPVDRQTAETVPPAWDEARRLEFDAADPTAAAAAYAAIARETLDSTLAAWALQAEARCLVQSGRPEEAIGLIAGTLADAKYGQAVDTHGRLIVPNAELMALGLMPSPDDKRFTAMAERLRGRLEDYANSDMAASQRRFLMHELERLSPGKIRPALLAAEDLAARFAEAHPSPRHDPLLQPSQLPEVWQLGLPTPHLVALFRTETILSQTVSAMLEAGLSDDVSVGLWPPGSESPGKKTFYSLPAGRYLPGWQVTLALADDRLVDTAASARVALYAWTGLVVVATMTLVAGLIGSAFRRQLRMAQLKNDLVATVSHELKTPLSSMRLLVDTLLDEQSPDPSRTREYLELMARENTRLSRLIDNFLTFSRMSRNKYALQLADVRVEHVIDAAVEAMRERLEQPRCQFELNINGPLPVIAADADALATVLINLLDNACKYTGDEKQIRLQAGREDGTLAIAVSDNGIGLSRAAARKVFERFYQADRRLSRSAGGCGLGLSIVKYIVEAHGGSVHVSSPPGEGSTFTVRLPVE